MSTAATAPNSVLLLYALLAVVALVVLMPISINILLFHSILEPGAMPITISLIIIVCQLSLAWVYRDYYKQLFIARPAL